ncbi:hypothetical protein Q361_1211 [Flavobacterium croceum DSM 17960]|uniref:DUF6438 domain-containing protein n=1 Tax=Flavobacterium croceum DSM 17960 TaxID=1121886 RepID=A0A2S4N537_9FLAO|nr:DUF6438 domain-containing protein [Flavobacterium croceum]POS00801.1 hypothetical protein Q361_1211 [Flavobacterium croceum DSM 17960]
MTKNYKYIFLLLLTLISCEKKPTKNYENIILGDWIFEKEIPKIENHFYTDFGYSFDKNGNCESKPGYFETKDKTEKEERKTIFYGTKTKYKIEGDSLYIFNLVSKKWNASKIIEINSKTLKLKSNKEVVLEFSKLNFKVNEKVDFDKIIISKSPCFGSCPINDIEINKNGEIYYYGAFYNSQNGYFKSKIKASEFNEIEKSLKKVNFSNLKDNYTANWTDDQEVSVTFVKNNKILKSITDYGRQSPKSFRINIEPLTYLYQKIKLEEDKTAKDFQYINLRFEKGNKIINLTSSEIFFLSNLLSKSITTSKSFKAKFITNYDTDYDVSRIETDGRFFKIFSKNKNSVTYDLGFNFIEKNELTKRQNLKNDE